MARSLQEIRQQLLEQKAANQYLDELDSTSMASIWRNWIYITAFCIWWHELIFDRHMNQVLEIEKAANPYNDGWWKKRLLAFQYGHPLLENGNYQTIDEAAQVIKQVAVIAGINILSIKIATLDANGDLVKIDDMNIYQAFKDYVFKIGYGQNFEIINQDADLLRIDVDVYYDPLKMTNEGVLIALDNGVNQVEESAKAYLSSLDFNGAFYIQKITDYIQATEAINDVDHLKCYYKVTGSEFNEIDRVYLPISGYMKIDVLNINFYAGQ